ncbi:toll/interleukin-1 receptor domain-containing protein [Aquimarina aggregata]|uniref:toll/interleukin-1 receptor domain-containing protein n=1 Tax=Aquimarina aggregata TaxID=1642818 RepID=UPI00249239A8|nr:toll/interleukin-1 receptor domain-containing protein [Aquimarina aggregata]
MTEESVIRNESKLFYERYLNDDIANAAKTFKVLKDRLQDFYSPQSKSVFLDEIKLIVQEDLKNHRDEKHGGNASSTCGYEKYIEAFLFYINQELGTLPLLAHQRYGVNTELRDRVFISYSHFDKSYLDEIKRYFKPFLNKIKFWDDSQILPGQIWKDEIEGAIKKAKIAILLVSTDFLGSDFINSEEIPPLLDAAEKEGTTILTLILRPCLFDEVSHLNQYQALNPPNRPVSKMDENEKEELYVNMVRQTKRILEI